LGLFLADAVGLLDAPEQLVALAGDDIEMVVGQFAPLLLDLAFQLLPVSFDDVPVHDEFLVRVRIGWMSDARRGGLPAMRSHRSPCKPDARGGRTTTGGAGGDTGIPARNGTEPGGKDYRPLP